MENQPATTTVTAERPAPGRFMSWNHYWAQEHNQPWRTKPEIDEERQRYLTERRSIQPDIEKGIYPFKDIKLGRADVEWLLVTHESSGMRGPVDWGDLQQRSRAGLDLRGAELSGADLRLLPLACMRGSLTFDEMFEGATDEVADALVHLERADLRGAQLQRIVLRHASLVGADLRATNLTRANLYGADLRDTRLGNAVLAGANMRRVTFSSGTNLYNAVLCDTEYREPRLRDVQWNGADLTVIDWSHVQRLGDERIIRTRERVRGNDYPNATRAYRQLATVLRSQGLTEDADRFAYRAQVLQRTLLRRQRRYGRWLFSLVLAGLSGYGYRLWRIFAAYALILVTFAAIFFLLSIPNDPATTTQQHALDSLLVSLTAVHGRTFFEQFNFTAQAWVAAIESVIGIVIESVFVAMLIQRFFSR